MISFQRRLSRGAGVVCAALLAGLAAASAPAAAASVTRAPTSDRVIAHDGNTAQVSADSVRPVPDTAMVRSAPMRVFADIEDAWLDNNVGRILAHFGRGKVRISVAGTGPSGGSFSRSQSYYLLRDLFRFTKTRHFEFVQFRTSTDDERSTFAIAERSYQRTDDGRLYKDKIYISLRRDDRGKSGCWVIDEIKSIR